MQTKRLGAPDAPFETPGGSTLDVNDSEGQGRSRGAEATENEDSFFADDSIGLYVVCDGASSEAAGEIASGLATRAIRAFIDRKVHERGRGFFSRPLSTATAVEAIDRAFDAIFEEARARPELARMTTTVTMLLISGEQVIVGHVGDSRLYRVGPKTLHQLTLDHPVTKPASGAPAAALQAVGVDAFSLPLRSNDVFLLCTDGVLPALADEAWALEVLRMRNVSRAAERILERSAELNTSADATAIVVRVEDDGDRFLLSHSAPSVAVAFEQFAFAAASS